MYGSIIMLVQVDLSHIFTYKDVRYGEVMLTVDPAGTNVLTYRSTYGLLEELCSSHVTTNSFPVFPSNILAILTFWEVVPENTVLTRIKNPDLWKHTQEHFSLLETEVQ